MLLLHSCFPFLAAACNRDECEAQEKEVIVSQLQVYVQIKITMLQDSNYLKKLVVSERTIGRRWRRLMQERYTNSLETKTGENI